MTIYHPSFLGGLKRRRTAPVQYYSPEIEPYLSMDVDGLDRAEFIPDLVRQDAERAVHTLRNTVHAKDGLIEIGRPELLEDKITWMVIIDVTDKWYRAISVLEAGLCYDSETNAADYDETIKFLERHIAFGTIPEDSQVWELLAKYDPEDARLTPTLNKFIHWKLGADLESGNWTNPSFPRR